MKLAELKLLGLDELLKTFKTLETKEAYKIQRSALRKSAKLMESKIKQATPYDTGELKNSWFVKVLRFSRQKMNIIFTVSNTPETFYGKFVEFGAMNFWNKKAMNKTTPSPDFFGRVLPITSPKGIRPSFKPSMKIIKPRMTATSPAVMTR